MEPRHQPVTGLSRLECLPKIGKGNGKRIVMKRLAILSTHPIQYNAPLYRLLAADPQTEVMVFFSKATQATRFDQDFGQEVVWDIPLTTGYSYVTIPSDTKPGVQDLVTKIETWKPDAILVYGWSPAGHLSCMRHFKGKIPVWFRGDSTIQSGRKDWKRTFRRIYLQWVYRHIDMAFYVGTYNKAYFLWAGLSEQQLRYAPQSVDNAFFAYQDAVHGPRDPRPRQLGVAVQLRCLLRHQANVFCFWKGLSRTTGHCDYSTTVSI